MAALAREVKQEKNSMQEVTDWYHAPIFDNLSLIRLILDYQTLHELDVKADQFSTSIPIPSSSLLEDAGGILSWSETNHLESIVFILIVHLGMFTLVDLANSLQMQLCRNLFANICHHGTNSVLLLFFIFYLPCSILPKLCSFMMSSWKSISHDWVIPLSILFQLSVL